MHWHYQVSARLAANSVIEAVLAYKEKHGEYPARLVDAGLHIDGKGGSWRIRYFVDERKMHSLIYPTTFAAFEAYIYTFEDARWIYLPD